MRRIKSPREKIIELKAENKRLKKKAKLLQKENSRVTKKVELLDLMINIAEEVFDLSIRKGVRIKVLQEYTKSSGNSIALSCSLLGTNRMFYYRHKDKDDLE